LADSFLPAGCGQSVRPAGPKMTLRIFYICLCIKILCVSTYHVWLLCVATMSSLAQLWARDGYREAEAT